MKSFTNLLKLTCISAGLFLSISDALAWGGKGHETTCAIAEQHLTRRAKKKISEILDGKSIVYYASWMDNASHTPEFAHTSTWHYANIDANETFEEAVQAPEGDVMTALETQIALLKSGKQTKEEAALSLKMVVHFMGDLHCPMHMGHKSDKGGNRWQVQFFNDGTNLHSLWDSKVVEQAHKWTFSEWVDQVDRVDRKTAKAITQGNIRDWGKETFIVCGQVYDGTPVGSKLSYDYVNAWAPVIEQQFLRGGLRLAAVLNDIF